VVDLVVMVMGKSDNNNNMSEWHKNDLASTAEVKITCGKQASTS
jgi:hypothetical protein